jgi:hypothetical protein
MINITNYETFFLLYADNELSETEREAVLFFVKENPLLADEFKSINSTKISPEKEIVFSGKHSLYVENFEDVETLYSFKPNLNIQYPAKEELYRHEEIRRIGWIKSFMAAASIVFIAGLFWIFMQEEDVVKKGSAISYKKEILNSKTSGIVVVNNENAVVSKIKRSNENKKLDVLSNEVQENINLKEEIRNESIAIVDTKEFDSEISIASEKSAIEIVNEKNTDALIQAEPIFINTVAKNETVESQNNDVINTNISSSKKAPFRGIIRKISRVIGKDRPESDQVKFIQVANFQLAIAQ